MARYIHCEECKNRLEALHASYNELYEYVKGTAVRDMFCDGSCYGGGAKSATPIKEGEICYAAICLPSNKHFNYEKIKPELWAHEFINPIK